MNFYSGTSLPLTGCRQQLNCLLMALGSSIPHCGPLGWHEWQCYLGRQLSSLSDWCLTTNSLFLFVVSIWITAEPLFGVIEGVSAGLFLIGMLVALVAFFICRQKTK